MKVIGRVFREKWHTIIRKNLHIGDKLKLPTIWGHYIFTVISIDDKSALLECGDEATKLERRGKYVWKYKHYTYNKNLVCRTLVSD